MKAFAAACFALALATPALAAVDVGQIVPDFRLTNSNGEVVQLSQFTDQTIILEWNNPGCPFVQRHYRSGNMQALQAEARSQGIVWLTINSGAPGRQGYMRGPAANEFVEQQNASPDHYLLDPRGVVGRGFEARTTPQMYVIDGDRILRYDGAIDDRPRAPLAQTRSATNYVRAALSDMQAGRSVRTGSTRPYGCSVKYADEG